MPHLHDWRWFDVRTVAVMYSASVEPARSRIFHAAAILNARAARDPTWLHRTIRSRPLKRVHLAHPPRLRSNALAYRVPLCFDLRVRVVADMAAPGDPTPCV